MAKAESLDGEEVMGIRKWPKNNEPARFPDLADPVVKGIRFAYSIKRRNKDKRIPWLGPDQGKYTKVSCLAPRDGLSKESLAWLLDDQGRDALDVLVAIAVQLGIEQGRRMTQALLAG
ncbi:MAG: hypothetical protein IIB58_12455 [Planctomycetes bacterium]|nr:hypothetical protein [Planctomycetota bacterium]